MTLIVEDLKGERVESLWNGLDEIYVEKDDFFVFKVESEVQKQIKVLIWEHKIWHLGALQVQKQKGEAFDQFHDYFPVVFLFAVPAEQLVKVFHHVIFNKEVDDRLIFFFSPHEDLN